MGDVYITVSHGRAPCTSLLHRSAVEDANGKQPLSLKCFLFKPSLPTLHLLGRLQPCAVTRPSSFCMWALTCLYWALFCSLRDGELHWSFLQQEYIFQYYLRLQSYIPAKWTSNTDGFDCNVEFKQ